MRSDNKCAKIKKICHPADNLRCSEIKVRPLCSAMNCFFCGAATRETVEARREPSDSGGKRLGLMRIACGGTRSGSLVCNKTGVFVYGLRARACARDREREIDVSSLTMNRHMCRACAWECTCFAVIWYSARRTIHQARHVHKTLHSQLCCCCLQMDERVRVYECVLVLTVEDLKKEKKTCQSISGKYTIIPQNHQKRSCILLKFSFEPSFQFRLNWQKEFCN